MGQITKNQEAFLMQRGYDTSKMDFDAASQLISQVKNAKQVNEPRTEFVQPRAFKPQTSRFDSQSAYVSYCKDLSIALLEFQVELIKAGFIKDVKQLESALEISNKAAEIIKSLKAKFEQ